MRSFDLVGQRKCRGECQGLWSTLRTTDLLKKSRQGPPKRQYDLCFLVEVHNATSEALLSDNQS